MQIILCCYVTGPSELLILLPLPRFSSIDIVDFSFPTDLIEWLQQRQKDFYRVLCLARFSVQKYEITDFHVVQYRLTCSLKVISKFVHCTIALLRPRKVIC